MRRLLFAGLALIVSLTGFDVAAQEVPSVDVVEDPELGSIIIAANGRTLYQYTLDEEGVSNCFDECAEVWLPYLVEEPLTLPEGVEGELTLIERSEGAEVADEGEEGVPGEAQGQGQGPGDMTTGETSRQVSYNGIPLYYYEADTEPGDVNGQGVDDVWFVVTPGQQFGDPVASPVASPAATPEATPDS